MTFNIINVIDENINENSLKKLINEKLYKIIQYYHYAYYKMIYKFKHYSCIGGNNYEWNKEC